MSQRTENDFIDWLSCASIYIGYARYGQLGGHGFVCVGDYDGSDEIATKVDDLNGGDIEALDAGDWLARRNVWIGNDPDPSKAMAMMVEQARRYYFDVLNAPAPRTPDVT
jgi:hypothetical protein